VFPTTDSKQGTRCRRSAFFEQVKNPITGEFFQLETLKAAGAVSPDFTLPPGFENKRFPVITVNSIYRMKASDGKEYLKSRQMYYGLDRLGNIINKSIDDQEVYDKPIWQYSQLPAGSSSFGSSSNPFAKSERKIVGATFVKVFDKPFTPENVDELFALVPGEDEKAKEAAVSLSIVKYDQSGNVAGAIYHISKYRDFRNRDFEELYDYASTPKTRELTMMGREEEDNENKKKHKQYG
jgi:hypothetical protein